METRSITQKRHVDEDCESSESERKPAERQGERKKQKIAMGMCAKCRKKGRLGDDCPKCHGQYQARESSESSETKPLKEEKLEEDDSTSEDEGERPYELDSECNSSVNSHL
jgi:hypothetical protein